MGLKLPEAEMQSALNPAEFIARRTTRFIAARTHHEGENLTVH
ncbi:hypothetical protein BOO71_0001564 [Deinococcus marmoris]|uniref:Uncharacterized protein n=1 Tax=Deinococcus marmoris TaxID=249408 RepID=A0A1U7P3I4_9DEIO|nr:hypothetical protein BOO71_0001564 [Deinococcus marmoris]